MINEQEQAASSQQQNNANAVNQETAYIRTGLWNLVEEGLTLEFDQTAMQLLNEAGVVGLTSRLSLLQFVELLPDINDRQRLRGLLSFEEEKEAAKVKPEADIPLMRSLSLTFPDSRINLVLTFYYKKASNRFVGWLVPIPEKEAFHFEATELMRAVIDNTTDYVFTVDHDQRLVMWNSGFADVCYRFLNRIPQAGDRMSDYLPENEHVGPWYALFQKALQGFRQEEELTLDLNQRYYYNVAANPIVVDGQITGVAFWMDDFTTPKRLLLIDELEKSVLGFAMHFDSLEEILYKLSSGLEELAPSLKTCVTIKSYDSPELETISSFSLPGPVNEAFKVIPIGPSSGSCGTAAYTGQPVMVDDISKSALWSNYKDIALLYGLKACMSFPILNSKSKVLGTIGAYLLESRSLTPFEKELLERSVKLAALVMDRFYSDVIATRRLSQLQNISKSVPGVIWEIEVLGPTEARFSYISKRCQESFGFPPEHFYGDINAFLEVILEDDRKLFHQLIEQADSQVEKWSFEFRVKNPGTQETAWYKLSAEVDPNLDRAGKISVYGVFINVSDLKDTEKLLHQKDEKLNSLISSLDDIIFVISEKLIFKYSFTRDEDKLLVPEVQFLGKSVFEILGKELSEKVQESIVKVNSSGGVTEFVYKLPHEGEIKQYRARLGQVVGGVDDEPCYFVSIRDITADQVNLELQNYRTHLLNAITDISKLFLAEGNARDLLPRVFQVLGETVQVNRISLFNSDTTLQDTCNFLLNSEWNDGTMTPFALGDPFSINHSKEFKVVCTDLSSSNVVEFHQEEESKVAVSYFGEYKSSLFMPIVFNDQVYAVLVVQDFNKKRNWTEDELSAFRLVSGLLGQYVTRTEAAAKLSKSETLNQTLLNSMSEGLLILNEEGVVVNANRAASDLLMIPLAELINVCFKDIVTEVFDEHRQQLSIDQLPCSRVFENGKSIHKETIGFAGLNNAFCWWSVNAEPLAVSPNGKIEQVLVTFTDITTLKQSELDFRKISMVAKHTSQSVVITNAVGQIEWVNEGFKQVSGFTTEEVLGKQPGDVFAGPNTDHDLLAIIRQKMVNKESFQTEYLCYNKFGEEFWSNIEIQPVFGPGNELLHYVVVSSDITRRKRSEELLRENVSEKGRLLNEIHLRVKNNLAIISSLLQLQKLYTSDDYIKLILQESQNRMKSLALLHEGASRAESYDKVALRTYVKGMVQLVSDSYGSAFCEVEIKTDVADKALEINQAIPFGLILNEVLTNVFRHAFKGKVSGSLEISISEKNNRLELLVQDNGNGLPKGMNWKEAGTMGLTLIRTLATQLHAEAMIESTPQGVIFHLGIPQTS